MRRAGSSSWRFAHGVEQLPHTVLYVCDALRLQVEPVPGVPPSLSEALPDRSGLLNSAARDDAAREWTAWWATVVQYEPLQHLHNSDDGQARSELVAEYHRAVNPETAHALVGASLRSAALTLYGEGLDWAGRIRADAQVPRSLTDSSQPFAWVLVRDAVEAAAAANGVDTGEMDGAVSVLLVEGDWWHLAAPGFALCSLAAATDPNVAGTMLRSVFESGLIAA